MQGSAQQMPMQQPTAPQTPAVPSSAAAPAPTANGTSVANHEDAMKNAIAGLGDIGAPAVASTAVSPKNTPAPDPFSGFGNLGGMQPSTQSQNMGMPMGGSAMPGSMQQHAADGYATDARYADGRHAEDAGHEWMEIGEQTTQKTTFSPQDA